MWITRTRSLKRRDIDVPTEFSIDISAPPVMLLIYGRPVFGEMHACFRNRKREHAFLIIYMHDFSTRKFFFKEKEKNEKEKR